MYVLSDLRSKTAMVSDSVFVFMCVYPFAHCVSYVRCGAILCDGWGDAAPKIPSISMVVVPRRKARRRVRGSRNWSQVEIVSEGEVRRKRERQRRNRRSALFLDKICWGFLDPFSTENWEWPFCQPLPHSRSECANSGGRTGRRRLLPSSIKSSRSPYFAECSSHPPMAFMEALTRVIISARTRVVDGHEPLIQNCYTVPKKKVKKV